MADDWEDWENEDFEPQLPPGANGVDGEQTKGSKLLSGEPDPSKFEGEDEEQDKPKWSVPKSQSKKVTISKYDESRGVYVDDDTPLDDPLAEKLRKQRLIEEADYAATQELFGAAAAADLDGMLPKSAKDFEHYAEALVAKYLIPHKKSPHYKLLLKQVVKQALIPLSVQETKDVETCVAGVRADKLKAETAAKAAAAKNTKKKQLNVGKSGGSAGLDDYQYDAADDDDYDFM